MIIISYDIKDNKLRTKFSKFIRKFGYRMQYSVYEITNSKHMLNNIMTQISNNFEKKFSQEDSVIIIETSENCKITKYGYTKNDDDDIIFIE